MDLSNGYGENGFINGVPPAFRKKNKLRACKILYSFSANPITNKYPKTHARIGIYKKMHRIIKRKKANPL
jgi:hypothetical protein